MNFLCAFAHANPSQCLAIRAVDERNQHCEREIKSIIRQLRTREDYGMMDLTPSEIKQLISFQVWKASPEKLYGWPQFVYTVEA